MRKTILAALIASIGIFISCDSATNNVAQEVGSNVKDSSEDSIFEKLSAGKSLTNEEWDILFNVIDTDTLAIRLIEGKYLGSKLNSEIDRIINILAEEPYRYNELINKVDSIVLAVLEKQNLNVKLINSVRKEVKEKINIGWMNLLGQKYLDGDSLPTLNSVDDLVNFLKAGKCYFGPKFDDIGNTIIQRLDRLDNVTYVHIEKTGSLYRKKLDELGYLDGADEIKEELVRDFISELNGRYLDELFEDAARLVVSSQMASTPLIQRKFGVEYVREESAISFQCN